MKRIFFINRLKEIVNLGESCKAIVYFQMRTDNGLCFKKANIQQDVLNLIAAGYLDTLQAEIDRFESDIAREVIDISSRDDRNNVVYRYDLPGDEPSFFSIMREVSKSHTSDYYIGDRLFNFETDSLSDIEYFVVELGVEDNKVIIYRNNFNVNLMKQAHGRFYLNKSGTQLGMVSDDILRMDSQIDMMRMDEDMLILNLNFLENNKEFATIVIQRAEESISIIDGLSLVDTVEGLRERLASLSFARRLMRAIDASPVIDLPKETVFNFINGHDKLKNILKVENNRIKLSSKKSQDVFVRLINDDFLRSLLTSQEYESTSKNRFV